MSREDSTMTNATEGAAQLCGLPCGHDRAAETRIAAVRALAERWRNAETWQGDPDIVSTAYGTLLLEALDGTEGSQALASIYTEDTEAGDSE